MKLNIALSSLGAVAAACLATPSASAQERYLGEIFMTGTNFCPRGTAEANGQLLAISQNQALFSLLGTTYGGDGRTTFALPDLRGRTAVHAGSGPGLSNKRLGQRGGSETQTLGHANLPSHNHVLNAHTDDDSDDAEGGSAGGLLAGPNSPAPTQSVTGMTGGSASFSVVDPYLVVQHCIVMQGIFPSRS